MAQGDAVGGPGTEQDGDARGRVRRVRDAVRAAARLELVVELDLMGEQAAADLDTLAELAAAIAGTRSAGLGIALPRRLVFAGAWGLPRRVQPLPAEETACGHVVAQRRSVDVRVTADAGTADGVPAAEARELADVARAAGAAVYAGHPVVVDGQVLGSLCVFDADPLDLDDHQRRVLALLARHASEYLEVRRDLLRLRRDQAVLRADGEVLAHLSAGRSLPRLLSVLVTDLAGPVPGSPVAAAVLLREDRRLRLAAQAGFADDAVGALADVTVEASGSLAGAAAACGVALDGSASALLGPGAVGGATWARAVPMGDDDPAGVVVVAGSGPVPGGLEGRLETTATLATLAVRRDGEAAAARRESVRDGLTDLLTRPGFLAAAQESLAAVAPPHSLLVLDVDRLRVLNDTLGHHRGDEALVALADRLRSAGRPSDLVARVGGDEFVVLCPGLAPDLARARAEVLSELVAQPMTLGGGVTVVHATVGVASTAVDDAVEDLLRRAEAALASAKRTGNRGGVASDDGAAASASHERSRLEHDLRELLRPGADPDAQLHLVFQPQLDLRAGAASGVEVLLRWDHPDLGPVAPDRFLPVAEDAGLMPELGELVLDRALRQHRSWAAEGSPWAATTLWVNVSATQLDDPRFADVVAAGLAAGPPGAPAVPLGLEITETAVTGQSPATTATLSRLRDLGVLLAVDDFGTGFSNLALLQRTRVDVVKIDRSLVAAMAGPQRDTRIVDAVLGLAGALDLDVVAEGVETPEQLRALAGRSCRCVQGYLLGRPRRAEDLELTSPGVWAGDAVPAPPGAAAAAGAPAPSAVLPDFDAAAREVLAHLRALSGMGLWTVTRAAGPDQVILVADSADPAYSVAEGTVLPWESSLCAQMVAGAPAVAPDVEQVPAYAQAPNRSLLRIGAYIGLPLHDHTGALFGSLCAFDPSPQPDRLHDLEPTVRVLARLLSTVLAADLERDELARRAERAEAEASVDQLTGVANRRGWHDVLAREEARCRRYGHEASVIVVDLDELKETNDGPGGHEAGDRLLRTTAEVLRRHARTGDLVARIGGDEFGVLAVQAGLAGAGAELERLRSALAAEGVSASAGLAARAADGSLETAWRAADAEMYVQKQTRRRARSR